MTIMPYEVTQLSEEDVASANRGLSAEAAGWYLVPPGVSSAGVDDLYQEDGGKPVLKPGLRGPYPSQEEAAKERDRLLAIDSAGATES